MIDFILWLLVAVARFVLFGASASTALLAGGALE